MPLWGIEIISGYAARKAQVFRRAEGLRVCGDIPQLISSIGCYRQKNTQKARQQMSCVPEIIISLHVLANSPGSNALIAFTWPAGITQAKEKREKPAGALGHRQIPLDPPRSWNRNAVIP